MATMLSQKLVEAQEANDTVRDFMRRFEVGKLLSSCRAQKAKGFSVVELFVYLVCCMFSPISTYMSMRIGSYREAFSKIHSTVSAAAPGSTGISLSDSYPRRSSAALFDRRPQSSGLSTSSLMIHPLPRAAKRQNWYRSSSIM